MTQNLKIEVLTGDISIDGMVVTNLVTKEELSTAIVKKADLGTDGKIPTSQLPAEIVNTAGIVDEVKLQLETSIKDAVDESNAYAESYTDNAMSSKADLVSGKVPLEQLPAIDQYPQFGTSLTNLSTAIMKDVRERTDELEKTKASLGEDGKVLRELIPSYEKISGLPEQLEVMTTQTAAVSKELGEHKVQAADQIVALKENINSNSEFLIETMTERLENYADKDSVKRGIANRYDSSLSYNLGERVTLTNGDTVKSTVDGNANDPNVNKKGWVNASHFTVNSIQELLSIVNPKNGMIVDVASYHAGLNLGGGLFEYDLTLAAINDGGFIINGWKRLNATDLNVTRFGARLDGVNDDTGAFKLAIAKAKANGGGRIVYFGKPLISDQLTIDFDNFIIEGLDYAKITTAFTSNSTLLTDGNGCLFAVYKNWGANFANNIKRPVFKNIRITKKDGTVKCIALMLSGVRYATIENIWSEYNRATLYLENVSECAFTNVTTQGSDFGIVLDGRYNRTSLLGFAYADTDVSNNTFIQTNIGWPQTAGIVNLGARQNRFFGAWIGHWGQNVLSSEFNDIPSVAAGVNVAGDNISITHSNIFDGFIFEPDRDRTTDCFVFQHRNTSSVIQSNLVSNSYVQIYSRDLTRPTHFVRFDLLQSNYNNRMASLVFENCGYYGGNSDGSISNTQYPPFSRVTGVGTAEPNGVIYRNIIPMTCLNLCPILGSRIDGSNALANVNITASNFLSDVVTTTEVKSGATVVGSFNTALAKDWTLDATSGGTATLVPNTGTNGTPAAVRFTGSTSKVFISKKFGGENIRSIRNQIGHIYVKFSYTGNTPPICEFIVNDASDTDSSVAGGVNIGRYGNARIQESTNSGNRVFIFRPFSANIGFTNFTVRLGRGANADPSAYTDISNIEIGWIAGNQTTYDPKA